jgi:hypothetical protein
MQLPVTANDFPSSLILFNTKMQALRSYETFDIIRLTRHFTVTVVKTSDLTYLRFKDIALVHICTEEYRNCRSPYVYYPEVQSGIVLD